MVVASKERIRNYLNFIVTRYCPDFSCVPFYFLFRSKGEKKLRYIRKGRKQKILICPYSGTGDVYLALALVGRIFEQEKDYVVIVIGKSNKKIVNLFGIGNVICVKEREMNWLVRYIGFIGDTSNNIFFMHPSPPQLGWGINDMLRNIEGINFLDMYKYGVFSGNIKKEFAVPTFDKESKLTEKLIFEKKLKHQNTVLLAPYSNTLGKLPDWIWVKIAKKLIEKGYHVFTNCASDAEKPIRNTEGIFIPYKELKIFLEYAGNFIGVRSGFCEVISSIHCKKVVLYQPYIYWGEGTCTDYFSLKGMNICEDVYELEYKGIEFEKLIDDVLALF